jgi:hypothetical protein
MVLFCCIGIFALFLFLSLFVPLIEREPRRRGVMVQGMMRSNYVILGIPVVQSMFGTAGSSIAAAFVAGAVADFMQWAVVEENAPLISGTGIRGYFVLGARRTPDVPYPNREWGYGRLNLQGVFDELRR